MRVQEEVELILEKNSLSLGQDEKAKEREKLENLDRFWNLGNIRWGLVLLVAYIHFEALRFIWILCRGEISWKNVVFQICYGYMGALGIVAGSHRLWSHRCYKATLPLRLILGTFQTIAGQCSIWRWCKDHRLHHKFAETNADPHNARRGFFFSHVGWILCPEHPMVTKKFKTLDMSDLEADPLVMFQYKYYPILVGVLCFGLPTWISWAIFGETMSNAWAVTMFRYALNINAVFCINSWAHLWGSRPYDKTINPAESKFLSILTCGEGWHNFHHAFSWDYKAAELGLYRYNFCTAFIDFFAWLGWAYELKTVPWKFVLDRVRRTGDGSYDNFKYYKELNKDKEAWEMHLSEDGKKDQSRNEFKPHSWGWGDKDSSPEQLILTEIHNRKKDRK